MQRRLGILAITLLGLAASVPHVSADDGVALRFLESAISSRATLAQAKAALGEPDAVLLLWQDDHDRAVDYREFGGGPAVKEVFWHNKGCQPVILMYDGTGQTIGADFTYYKSGCKQGWDAFFNLPSEYACTRVDRAKHCK